MKKISSIAAISLVVFLGTPFAFAQETGTASVPPKGEFRPNGQKTQTTALKEGLKEKLQNIKGSASSTKDEVKQKVESARVEIQNKKEEIRNNIEVKRVEMAKQWGEKTMKRLDETILRLEKIAGRIESRITKMKAENKDTAQAEKSLSAAKQKIAQAKENLASVKLFIADFSRQTTAEVAQNAYKPILGQNIQKIKDQIRTVTDSLKAARQSLTQAITDLKAQEGMKKNTATSTKQSETTI